MSNIVIYSTKPMPEMQALLADIDEAEVRVVSIEQMKDYAVINPSLMIVENIELAKDALMTNKFPCPILFFGPTRRDVTVRAEGFDFIKDPSNKDELIVRVNALLRIKTIKDKLEKVSTTDDLTGLHNRKYLQERLEEEISRSKRYGTKLSCILFDIDFFKVVNDMFGYEWGDILLRNIANKLNAMKNSYLYYLILLKKMLSYSEKDLEEKLKKWNLFLPVKKKHIKLQFPAEFRHTRACRMLMKMQTLL